MDDEQALNERTLEDLHDYIVRAFNTVNYLIENRVGPAVYTDTRRVLNDLYDETRAESMELLSKPTRLHAQEVRAYQDLLHRCNAISTVLALIRERSL